jgi:murein L,D-transpeptidase YcbB/YkuD
VDEDGSIQFRNDVYGRDKLLDKALHSAASMSGGVNALAVTP